SAKGDLARNPGGKSAFTRVFDTLWRNPGAARHANQRRATFFFCRLPNGDRPRVPLRSTRATGYGLRETRLSPKKPKPPAMTSAIQLSHIGTVQVSMTMGHPMKIRSR